MRGLEPGDDWTALLAGFLVAGGGIGLVNPALATAAVGVVEPQRAGMASGINSTFRQVGIATGIAAWGAIFQHLVDARRASSRGARGAARRAASRRLGRRLHLLRRLPPDRRPRADHARPSRRSCTGSTTSSSYAAILAFVGAILAARARAAAGLRAPHGECRRPLR